MRHSSHTWRGGWRVGLAIAVGLGLCTAEIEGQEATAVELREGLSIMEPFLGTWRSRPMQGRRAIYYVRRAPVLNGWAFTTREGPSVDGSPVHFSVENLTAWNTIESDVLFQEHSNWGNFVRGRIESLRENVVRRHMDVWNVDGTRNVWWETWTYDPDADTYSAVIRRVVDGAPVEDEAFPAITFERVERIPGHG